MFVTTPAKCHHKLQCAVIYITMCLRQSQVHHRHAFLLAPTAGEMPRTASASLHCLRRSEQGLFQLLIGCPPNVLSKITAFHSYMKSTVRYDRAVSNAFPIKSRIKQGCVLAPTLFGIFFSFVLSHSFRTSEYCIYTHIRSDGKHFNLAHLKAKSKIRKVLIRELFFADDAALTPHTTENIQRLIDRFVDA